MSRHLLRSSALLIALLLPGRSAPAQSASSLLTDASVLPRHGLAVTLRTSWSRFDELIGTGNPRNLAASFNTDSLGGAQIAQLGYTENIIRSLSGNSGFRLTAGNLVAAANSRVLTAPLILEYGLTSKLSIGVVVPLVETRTTLGAQLNPRPGAANVGPNPALATGNYSANAGLVSSFRAAAAALTTRLAQCQATPSGTGCSTLLGQQTQAQALIQSTGTFAGTLEQLYGTGSGIPGMLFVPLATSDVQAAIGARVQSFITQYQSFGTTPPSGALSAAGGPAANAYLNSVLTAAGYDTLQSADRSSIGDITIGATWQVANSFDGSQDRGTRYRLALNAGARIGTGQPASRSRLFDNATGYGQPGLIVGAAGDFGLSTRLALSAIGSYTMNFGTVDVTRVPNAENAAFPLVMARGGTYSAGNVMTLALVPRIHVAGYLSVTGNYQMVRTAADSYTLPVLAVDLAPGALTTTSATLPFGNSAATAQQVGFGFAYSTISAGERGPGRIPFEVSFRHLETLAASGGPVPKTFEDQLQLRVFFR